MGNIEQESMGCQINTSFSVSTNVKFMRKHLGSCYNCKNDPSYKELLSGITCNSTKDCHNGSCYDPKYGESKDKDN